MASWITVRSQHGFSGACWKPGELRHPILEKGNSLSKGPAARGYVNIQEGNICGVRGECG